ncbi:MAG: ATP-binding protein, partial [Pseudomonadota bacterium]
QKKLVAASRLAALGEMSAGISHELNQPLGAIRNFAENGKTFLERGRPQDAEQNFDMQIAQVDRIGRIIKSLRAFARNEEQTISAIDLCAVVDSALSLADLRLKREGVTVERHLPPVPVHVLAGQVRLQQVLVNLLGNAIDAMASSDAKEISLDISTEGEAAYLTIGDTGTGISEPDRIFDPFFSTKDLGGSSGMGLGLSISHGIVGSFGGALTCANKPEGGAEFCISLPRAPEAA